MKNLKQRTVTDNKEIFKEILQILITARKQIQVASAWFTDPELLNTLIQKQKTGVKVSVIISDQKDNQKLPFHKLIRAGGKVTRVKNSGYGVMHQKFCIVDSDTLIHGSYNWTVNAKNNNHESVIITNYKQTILEMQDLFNKLEEGKTSEQVEKKGFLQRLFGKRTKAAIIPQNDKTEEAQNKVQLSDPSMDYRDVLDNLIKSELQVFDREQLKQYGFDRSKLNNGNHGVVANSLDAIYARFLDDVSISQEKLNDLKMRVELVRNKALSTMERYKLNQTAYIDRVYKLKLNERINALEDVKSAIDAKLLHLDKLEEKKTGLREKLRELKHQFNELGRNQVIVKPKQYEYILLGSLAVGLIVYLFFFYTSAGYIMLFSGDDARMAELRGLIPNLPDIYDYLALSKAFAKGLGAIAMISFFFLLPFGLAILMIYKGGKKNRMGYFIGLIGIFIVDAFMAGKVSQSIFEVKYLMGEVSGEWNVTDLIYDSNFYLVFMFGMLGLLVFEFIGEKIKSLLDNRNEDTSKLELKQKEDFVQKLIDAKEDDLNEINELLTTLKIEKCENEVQVALIQREIDQVPIEKERELKLVEDEVHVEISEIETNCDIVIAKLESGNLPFSKASIKERVSIFMEGWNDFLYEFFATTVAQEKSALAAKEKEQWLNDKFNLDSDDSEPSLKVA